MKKITLLLACFCCFTFGYSQETNENLLTNQPINEISLNLPLTIFGEFPMLTYERITTEEIGIGASAGFAVGDALDDALKYQLVPFARWYFLGISPNEVYGRKFFIEANASVFGYEETYWEYQQAKTENKTGYGLGLGLGYKYVNKNNWIGIIHLGAGKNFSNSDEYGAYPHLGINIGKRF